MKLLETHRRIVSGKSKGLPAAAARGFLRLTAAFWAAGIRVRNVLFDLGLRKTHRVEAAVISVGNLTTGGTGKTPMVIWLTEYLCHKQVPCAVLTRGYKTKTGTLSDEPALLARACKDAAVIVNSDRVAGARKAIAKYGAKALILDDGFQHRRLGRDLDLLTVDATCPFGYGKFLPAGFLREPLSSLKRARGVVLTRCDQAEPEQLDAIEAALRAVNPDLAIVRSVHRSTHAKTFGNRVIDLETLRRHTIFAFCGIGNPDSFLKGLTRQGLNVAAARTFDDHHAYSEKDMQELIDQAGKFEADLLLTTEKDWVKAALLMPQSARIPLACMVIELDFLSAPDTIHSLIDQTLNIEPRETHDHDQSA